MNTLKFIIGVIIGLCFMGLCGFMFSHVENFAIGIPVWVHISILTVLAIFGGVALVDKLFDNRIL